MGFADTTATRVAGSLSLLALLAVTFSDFLLTEFWDRNAMVTGVVADIFVLVVGVAVVNEFLATRSRRQWKLVADYALVELSRSCRRVWIRLAEAIGVASRRDVTRDALRELIRSQEGQSRTAERASAVASDSQARGVLHPLVAELSANAVGALTSWAPILVETPNAGALSRYVELQAMLSELDLALSEEAEGRRPTEGTGDPDWIGQRIEAAIRLGSELEAELYASVGEDGSRLAHKSLPPTP